MRHEREAWKFLRTLLIFVEVLLPIFLLILIIKMKDVEAPKCYEIKAVEPVKKLVPERVSESTKAMLRNFSDQGWTRDISRPGGIDE